MFHYATIAVKSIVLSSAVISMNIQLESLLLKNIWESRWPLQPIVSCQVNTFAGYAWSWFKSYLNMKLSH